MFETIDLNGKKYLSIDSLLNVLTMICVDGSSVEDLYISESERDNLSACQEICNYLERDLPGFKKMFKTKYMLERFQRRTLGV